MKHTEPVSDRLKNEAKERHDSISGYPKNVIKRYRKKDDQDKQVKKLNSSCFASNTIIKCDINIIFSR